jgi:hypothetical protein
VAEDLKPIQDIEYVGLLLFVALRQIGESERSAIWFSMFCTSFRIRSPK